MAVHGQASALFVMLNASSDLTSLPRFRIIGAKVGSCKQGGNFLVRSCAQRQDSTLREMKHMPTDETRIHSSKGCWMVAQEGAIGVLKLALTSLFCSGVAGLSPLPQEEAWMMHGASQFDVTHLLAMSVSPAHASGLLQMPPVRLVNRYYLVRAGESEFETKGIIKTNPVAKTSVDSGLSEKGKKQTIQAAKSLRALGACDGSCWIWPSITQRAHQTAEIIAYASSISRSRIVPEYSFLDARGLGAYEGRELAAANEVYDMDALSPNLRPPPYTDGTPNESVADVFVRVTQLMSILETQYFGDTIVIVSPDSDNLSVLEAGLTGLDLRRHRQLAYTPGEVRSVDARSIPAPRPAVSGYIKCTAKPPGLSESGETTDNPQLVATTDSLQIKAFETIEKLAAYKKWSRST